MNFHGISKDAGEQMEKVVNYVLGLPISPQEKRKWLIYVFGEIGGKFFDKMFGDASELFDSTAMSTNGLRNNDNQIPRLATKLLRNDALSRSNKAMTKLYFDSIQSDAIEEAFANARSLDKHPTLTRYVVGETCNWCNAMAGTHINPTGDMYRRHADCDCILEYSGVNGRKEIVKNYSKKSRHQISTPKHSMKIKINSNNVADKKNALSKRIINIKINFAKNFPKDVQKAHVERIEELFTKFPKVYQEFELYDARIGSNGRLQKARAQFLCWPDNNFIPSGIEFGTQYKNIEEMEKLISDNIKSKHHMPASRNNYKYYDATHEFGHAVENMIIRKMLKEEQISWATNGDYNAKVKQIMAEVIAIARENNPEFKLKDNISKYGTKNGEEFFAEVFANGLCGKPNELGKSIVQYLKEKGYYVDS